MCRRSRKISLFRMAGIVAVLFLSLTPGFGVQYLAWVIPWTVEFGIAPVALFHLSSGIMLFFYYSHFSQGLPWYLADTIKVSGDATLAPYFLLCWVSVLVLLFSSLRAARFAGFTCAILAAAVVFPAVSRVRSIPIRHLDQEDVMRSARVYSLVKVSNYLLSLGKFGEAIVACDDALRFDSKSAEAHLNAASAHLAMKNSAQAASHAMVVLITDPKSPDALKILKAAKPNQLR
jgi:hypothetical protein